MEVVLLAGRLSVRSIVHQPAREQEVVATSGGCVVSPPFCVSCPTTVCQRQRCLLSCGSATTADDGTHVTFWEKFFFFSVADEPFRNPFISPSSFLCSRSCFPPLRSCVDPPFSSLTPWQGQLKQEKLCELSNCGPLTVNLSTLKERSSVPLSKHKKNSWPVALVPLFFLYRYIMLWILCMPVPWLV